ncbi:MAG: aminotransferase class I/II-fold pyridoxal phosphate-dependent enzyme [Pseudoflavonifractor sp.]|nr:aminotransferase class I/II-fold pyridoxal phosphate-dependent enzyme [Alloprevotella sp.]MCM1116120.1 aminotransferase class I/II-fold pyridoxal phosphate-dependent enzyme [Pseudoflavonifractor sp.]
MQAIILAAGMGKRLRRLTADNTKCMVEVDGEKLIDRLLAQLASLPLDRIVIVTGYEGNKLRNYLASRYADSLPLAYVDNPVYDKTNNIYSLWLAREYLEADDTLLIESDLIFSDGIIDMALLSPDPNVALVAKYEPWMDGTMVTITPDGQIDHFVAGSNLNFSEAHSYYKTVNVYKLSREFSSKTYLPFLEAYIKVMGNNEYYEQVLRVLTFIGNSGMKAIDIGNRRWYEIDDIQDLNIAETLFAHGEDRLRRLQLTYGGYWRFPSLLDFCYLVNPYFPTPAMEGELKARFSSLLRQYPSGMEVNALLAGKYFGVGAEYICPGNGAAELIKSLMEHTDPTCRLGIVEPTFEEYPNRRGRDSIVAFRPKGLDFSYTADDLINFFTTHHVEWLLLINPDNPSGNYIPRADMERLATWADEANIRLIVDESFIDFANSPYTLIDETILDSHPRLIVIKSISKSYGVPGLRLGVAASADHSLIKALKRDVAIWNINSLAEYYMQIFSKYEQCYREACRRIRDERNRMASELGLIRWLQPIPSEANYFLCRIDPTSGFDSHSLTLALLESHDILIKDCASKHGFDNEDARGRYVRIAVRDRHDNDRLLAALNRL